MRHRSGLRLAFALVLALAAASATASATRLEFPNAERGFRAVWRPVGISGAFGTVRCNLTLEGSFVQGVFAKSRGLRIGDVTNARVELCPTGSATVLRETLPWSLHYGSFAGALPSITSVSATLVGLSARIREPVFGITCALTTTEANPAVVRLATSSGRTTSLRFEETASIPCESLSGSLSGTTSSLETREGAVSPTLRLSEPWVASVGDSYIAGEAGRWAGNTATLGSGAIDALGERAYDDGGFVELEPFCHRSASAEIGFGRPSPQYKNFACTGATLASYSSGRSGEQFKPGLDFYASGSDLSQLVDLREFARLHAVKMVAVSIGGNDLGFARIVELCVVLYGLNGLGSPCSRNATVVRMTEERALSATRTAIKEGILNVERAMAEAGYEEGEFTILVQDYPSPIPPGTGIRYAEHEGNHEICPIRHDDAEWANATLLPDLNEAVWNAVTEVRLGHANIVELELASTFNGRRLCETGVELLKFEGIAEWRQAGAVDGTEWINRIQLTDAEPFYQQESLHPNYWAQLALRSCLRQAYNGGRPRGGTCTRSGTGLTEGEPRMRLE